jgi:tape measure domain-containing protein
MALTDLNVALRLSTREFNRELNKATNSLQQASDRMASIGNTLTLGVTVPLLAIGAGAVQAAGEFEKLKLGLEATMAGAGYSIAEARMELEKLREVARAPGIDFEQAVKGSLRLQAVGLSADQARETIAQFANGVAAAGGTADNLNSVTTQISQIIGKGKILNEDLKILKENMPSISRAMVSAFGTADAEGLRALNISAEELVVRLTQELAKAPRVAGGIANSITNAQVSIQAAAARIGDALNKAFNIQGGIDKFATFIETVADAFANLTPETQRAIFAVAGFAIALGPAIRLGGLFVTTYGDARIAMAKFARFANGELRNAMAGGATGVGRLITAFKALDATTKATITGVAIGVFIALAAAVATYASASDEAAKKAKILSEIQTTAKEQAASQIVEVEQLVRAFNKENATQEQKEGILKRLQEIAPKYYGQLDAAKVTTEQLTEATKLYRDELIRVATIKAATDKIAQLELAMADLKEEAELTPVQVGLIGLEAAAKSVLNPFKALSAVQEAVAKGQQQVTDNAAKAKKAYEDQRAALEKLIDANQNLDDLFKKTKTTPEPDAPGGGAPTAAPPIDLEALRRSRQQFQDFATLPTIQTPGAVEGGSGLKQIEKGLDNIRDKSRQAAEGMAALVDPVQKNIDTLTNFAQKAGLLFEVIDNEVVTSIDKFGLLGDTITGISNAIASGLGDATDGWATFKNAAVEAIGDVIGKLVQQFVAQIIANTAKAPAIAALGPAAIPIAAGAGVIASAAFKRVVGAAKFADGGVVYGPTLGLVGEYPGASTNPEVIAPLSKLKNLIEPSGGMELQTRISGNDLLVLLERTEKQRNRFR